MSESFEVFDAWKGAFGMEYDTSYIIRTKASSTIKYLLAQDDQSHTSVPDIGGRLLRFKAVPPGDWTFGRLGLVSSSRGFALESTEKSPLPDLGTRWSPRQIDFLSLPPRQATTRTTVRGVRHDDDPQSEGYVTSRVVVMPGQAAKADSAGSAGLAVAFWAWDWVVFWGLGHECDVYGWVDGHGVAPRFLAHITANRKHIIGFVVERIEARAPTSADLDSCRAVLGKLHALGIVYGPYLRRSSFLIDQKGTAFMQRFSMAEKSTDANSMAAEMDSLPSILAD